MSNLRWPPKTIEAQWIDWEAHVFGFGYGSGEPHTLAALKNFMGACQAEGGYDYQALESILTPTVAWLLINTLAHHDILEYGTSPRYAWLTKSGKALKEFCDGHTLEELATLATSRTEDDPPCYPDTCNHGPRGHDARYTCTNVFWGKP